MAGREPLIPPISADGFLTTPASVKESAGGLGRWRRTVGLLLLVVIIFLWTATNFLASSVLADHSYSKPFFMTYFNTSFFILPMIPVLIGKAYRRPEILAEAWRQWRHEIKTWFAGRRTRSKKDKGDEVYGGTHARRESLSTSRELLLGEQRQESPVLSTRSYNARPDAAAKLSLHETAKLSLEFCILWFLANYAIVSCLQFTTVASSTILTSTSGIFTLIFGTWAGVEKFTLRKLIGVLASLAGIMLISSVDLSGKSSDDEHRGYFPEKSVREMTIGNILALLSAIGYGLYSVLMKKRIANESQVNMPIFFGFVGLTNVLLLWPAFFLLHWSGIEKFALPSRGRVISILIINATGSTIADLAWAYAVLLTSPIVVTVGLSMTIPLSLIGQMLLNSQTATGLYWVGAIVVVLSFLFVNHEEESDEQAGDGNEGGLLQDH